MILCSVLYTFYSYFISFNSVTWTLAAYLYNIVSFCFVKTTFINHLMGLQTSYSLVYYPVAY